MKSLAAATSLCLLASLSAHADDAMTITRNGSQRSNKAPAQYFTGSVRVDPLFQRKAPSRVSGGSVTFEPGARSAWHTHPLGQTLIVTAGTGWVQQEGGPKQEIKPGDVIWTPPGVRHWRSVRPHAGSGNLPIECSATATGNGLSGPTVETRHGGIQRIEAQVGTYALHRLGAYRDRHEFPGASRVFDRAVALPFHTRLTESDLDRVAEALTSIVSK